MTATTIQNHHRASPTPENAYATARAGIRRDTGGWRLQVWVAFALAVGACTIGVLWVPGQDLERAFLCIGLCFCVFASLAVAKALRDNRDRQVDTAAWVRTVWAAFALAVALTAWGLWRMDIGGWEKGSLVIGWLFLVSSTFTLAKTLRDQHEADLAEQAHAADADN